MAQTSRTGMPPPVGDPDVPFAPGYHNSSCISSEHPGGTSISHAQGRGDPGLHLQGVGRVATHHVLGCGVGHPAPRQPTLQGGKGFGGPSKAALEDD